MASMPNKRRTKSILVTMVQSSPDTLRAAISNDVDNR